MLTTTKKHSFTVLASIAGVVLAIIICLASFTHNSHAVDPSAQGFSAGNIIDDYTMTNTSTMTVAQIQDFLNSKVPTCDTSGSQLSEHNNSGVPDYNGDGSIERWEYGKFYFNQTTFTCLKDYSQNGLSSAQIIYNASQKYQINPEVLITLLQKEQGLVTDTWPANIQYRSATGYGCPDTSVCDSQYYGLTNQINWSATMFHAIETNNPNWYTPYILGNNYIQYSPDSSCGGSTVNIENRATQGLYNYTPYQPNDAALNAPMGALVNCGAYGNLNFYRYFTQWFGNPNGSIQGAIHVSSSLSITPNGSDQENQQYTATFGLTNDSNTTIDVGYLLVSVRDIAGFNLDFPVEHIIIGPNQTYTYKEARTFEWTGNMNAYINGNLAQGIGWSTNLPTPLDSSIIRNVSFRVGSDVVISSAGVTVTKTSNTNELLASTTFINRTASDVNIGWYLVSLRNPAGVNIDFPTQNIIVPANGQATYSQTEQVDLSNLGVYSYFANLNNNVTGGRGWTTTYPMRNDIWTSRSGSFQVGPNVIQTGSLTTTVDSNDKTTATITFKNQGQSSENLGWVVVSTRREGDNTNYDFPLQNVTLNAGQSKTLSFSQYLLRPGNYIVGVTFNRIGGWDNTYAPVASSDIARSLTFTAYAPVKQMSGTSITSSGSLRTVHITLTNSSDSVLDLGWIIPSVRDNANNNLDFPGMYASLQPGETRTFTSSRIIDSGTYTVSLTANHPLYGWGSTFQVYTPSDVFTLQ